MGDAAPLNVSATPAEGQLVSHEGKIYNTIREGRAYILVPPNAITSVDPKAAQRQENGHGSDVAQTVFYNPIQQFNRDLSVLAIKAFAEHTCESKRKRIEENRSKNKEKRELKRKRGVNGAVDSEIAPAAKIVKVEVESRDKAELQEQDLSTSVDTGTQSVDLPVTNGVHDVEGDSTSHDKPIRPGFRILDALSATGLRALRYASEIPQATAVTANDLSSDAVASIRLNVQHNNLTDKIKPNVGNAIGYMYSVAYPPVEQIGNYKFDVVDLDPYGTAAPFIDAALQSINDEGLLCVTCTDSGVFASVGYSEKTFSLYGGIPIKGPHSHEGGLRIILHSIAIAAGRYGMAIEPLLSLSIDFYARVFVRVRRRPADVKFLSGKTMVTYQCDSGCGAWTMQTLGRNVVQKARNGTISYKHTIAQAPNCDRTCEHCGNKTHMAGPMWAGPIHNASFIEKILHGLQNVDEEVYKTLPRIEGMLVTALEELHVVDNAPEHWPAVKDRTGSEEIIKTPPQAIDMHPFFFIPSALAKVLHCRAPPEAAVKGALRRMGFRATRSHCKPGSIKTNASWSTIWRVFRTWATEKAPIKEGSLQKNHAGYKIMYEPSISEPVTVPKETNGTDAANNGGGNESAATCQIVFDENLGRDTGRKLVRYQVNPRENWGPMARARKMKGEKKVDDSVSVPNVQ